MKTSLVTAVGLCLSLFFSACGSGGDGGTCSNTAACGGDLVGTWKLTSSCIDVDTSGLTVMGCAGETVDAKNFKEIGTVMYNADKTYSASVSLLGSIVMGLPKACLTQQGVTLTCDQLNQAFQQSSSDVMLACANRSDGGCNCTMTLPPTPSTESGTYTTTAAGLVTQTPTNGAPSSMDYCVKGSTASFSPHADTTMMMGQPGISGTITATKQ